MTDAKPIAGWTTPQHDGEIADALTHADMAAFLAYEAEALDRRHFARWQEMVDDGFIYRVPVPVLHDSVAGPAHDTGSLLIDEDKQSIVELWFRRFTDEVYEVAWGDHPPVRMRHLVTNVRVRHTDNADIYDVASNVRLHMVRQTTHTGVLTAERFDQVRRTTDGLRLLSRFAVLDDLVLDAPQLRVIL